MTNMYWGFPGNSGRGMFDQGAGTLTLYIVNETQADKDMTITFTITNPFAPQESPPVYIRTLGVVSQTELVDKDLERILPDFDGAVAGDAAPLKVSTPRPFVVHSTKALRLLSREKPPPLSRARYKGLLFSLMICTPHLSVWHATKAFCFLSKYAHLILLPCTSTCSGVYNSQHAHSYAMSLHHPDVPRFPLPLCQSKGLETDPGLVQSNCINTRSLTQTFDSDFQRVLEGVK